MTTALRNFAAGFLAAYGWVSFFCFIFLEQKWTGLAPKTQNFALGLIYQHNDHGSYTYFSAFQATTCALMLMTSIPLFFAAIGIAPKKNFKSTVGKFSIRWRYDSDDPTAIRWKAALVSAFVTPIFVFIVGPHIVKTLNSMGVVMNFG